MNIHLTPTQQTKVVLDVTRPTNRPPVWGVSDRNVIALTVAPDAMSADIVALEEGQCSVSVVTNCDLGSGFCSQSNAFDVTVSSTPNVVHFYAAVPVDKPSETPQDYWTPQEDVVHTS